jgi:transposase InsO family protein
LLFELGKAKVSPLPSRSTIYRVLVRHHLVAARKRKRRRQDYKRWQRDEPMQLWQLDVTGSVFRADGRELKLISGIDDHSRFCVIATVVRRATARAVCRAFLAAVAAYGIPEEVLTDIQAVHRAVRQAPPSRGAVRADLPQERHPPAADQAVLADHHRQSRTVAPDPAGRLPQRRRAVRHHRGRSGRGRWLAGRVQP